MRGRVGRRLPDLEPTDHGARHELVGTAADPGIVQVDTDHFGPIGLADPADPDSDALVVLAYNIVDGSYYDCDATQYTVGYFAPEFIDEDGMNVIVVDTQELGRAASATRHDRPDDRGRDRPRAPAPAAQLLRPGRAVLGRRGPRRLRDLPQRLPRPAARTSTYHQVFHRETSLTRWGGGLENYGASFSFFQYLWEQAGGNGGGNLAPDQVYYGDAPATG